jgi:TolB-like protein/Tfp pilus assembly protein PilF
MSFFNELKRRNVFRVGIAYAVASWLLLQLSDILVPLLNLPESAQRLVLLLLVIGFFPALIFAWAFEMTPDGIKKEKDVDRSQSITGQTGHKLDRSIIVVLLVAVVYFAWDNFSSTAPESVATPEVTPGPAPVEYTQKSIAVLPFTNMSEDASNEYFSDGISEEILNSLAKVTELKVAGRTSSFAFKGRNEDLRLIGETLGVSHILEGSVRKAGNKVRITAQLIKVDDGFHLWSDTYDRELTDIFAIQDEIAGAILEQLKATLLDGQSIATTPVDTRAYELYLLARQRIYTRNRMQLESALELLDEALEIDPGFAPAWAQKGITNLLLSDQSYGTIPFVESQTRGRLALNKAIELDPQLAEGWAGLGLYQQNQPIVEERVLAVASLRKALAINPNLINASNWLHIELNAIGQPQEALQIVEDMLDRDPLYKPGIGNAVITYIFMGKTDEAMNVLKQAQVFLTDDPDLIKSESFLLNNLGRTSESLQLANFAYQRKPTDITVYFSLALALSRNNQFEQLADINTPNPGFRISALSYLGRTEEALILAYQWASSGNSPSALFATLVKTGKYTELIDYLEQHWADLDALDAAFPASFGFGYQRMLLVAEAYRHQGNQAKFEQAMALSKRALDKQVLAGADSSSIHRSLTQYWVLAAESEKAMDALQKYADKYGPAAPRLSDLMPLLKPLEGEPRYEKIQLQMLDHLNSERAKLGLEPVGQNQT